MNYIGSKLSLIDFIKETIDDLTGITNGEGFVFGDLFAGTGIVGSIFKKKGFTVLSNDIQHYSYVLNKHLIENHSPINTELLDYFNDLDGIDGFVFKNYCAGSGSGRNYFTDYNGRKCDAIRTEIERLYNNNEIDSSQYYYFLASLLDSIDKYANTASVYGAFLKHIKKSAQRKFKLELLPIIDGGKDGKVFNTDINELISQVKGDILYLDPPYNNRQYSSNYHVLETISRYDNPVIKGKTGLREDDAEQKSKFCYKRTVEEEFDYLIKNANFKYIFLSYNNEGLMPLENIKQIMSKYGHYSKYTKNYRRFRADKEENRNHKATTTTEYLHCLTKVHY